MNKKKITNNDEQDIDELVGKLFYSHLDGIEWKNIPKKTLIKVVKKVQDNYSMPYRTIKDSFWTDPKIRKLSPNEKYLMLYFITNQHSHYSGVYYLPISYIIEESGLKQEEVLEKLSSLELKFLIMYDKETSTIFVVKMFKHQNSTGGNPNVIMSGLGKQLSNIHSEPIINAFIKEYQYLNVTLIQGCVKVASRLFQGSVPVPVPVSLLGGMQGGGKIDSEENKKKKKNKTTMPVDFGISERVREWAKEKEYTQLEDHLEAFKNKVSANGYEYVNWDSAFMESIRGDWAKLRNNKNNQKNIIPRKRDRGMLDEIDDFDRKQKEKKQ